MMQRFRLVLVSQRSFNSHILLQIDEVHMLNETRGATLEAVISRMKAISASNINGPIRFLAISATIPNVADIGRWLSGAEIKLFGDEFRPVPLQKLVFGYPNANQRNPFIFEQSLDFKFGTYLKTSNELQIAGVDRAILGGKTNPHCTWQKATPLTSSVLLNTEVCRNGR